MAYGLTCAKLRRARHCGGRLYAIDHTLSGEDASVLTRNSQFVSWANDTEVQVDALEFMRLSDHPETLEDAAAVYGGDFAPQIDHKWGREIRDRLQRKMCHVLDQLIAQYRNSQDPRRSLDYVERLLSVDPWREDVVRDFMMMRYFVGDRVGALRFYRSFVQNLRSEFDVEPMPETVKCFESISNGSRPRVGEGAA